MWNSTFPIIFLFRVSEWSEVRWIYYTTIWGTASAHDWCATLMPFLCQTAQTWLYLLSNSSYPQGCKTWFSLTVYFFKFKNNAVWMLESVTVFFGMLHLPYLNYLNFLLQDSEQRRHEILTSFLTEIILALKEVLYYHQEHWSFFNLFFPGCDRLWCWFFGDPLYNI